VAAASLFGIASPAVAGNPEVQITEVSGVVSSGQSINMKFRVTNGEIQGGGSDEPINVVVSSSDGGALSCNGDKCNFTETFEADQQKGYQVSLKAGNLAPGESRQVTITIAVSGTGQAGSAERTITVQGPQESPTVPEVSGVVVDVATAKPIPAAQVWLQDSASPPHEYNVGTNKDGVFKFTSKADAPIMAGVLGIRVEKDGIETYSRAVTAQAGLPVRNLRLTVKVLTSAAPTESAQPTETSGNPSFTPIAGADGTTGSLGGDGGGLSWILIAIGGVLVLLGIGAIVLLFIRKRDDEGEEAGTARPGPRRGGPPMGPPGRGGQRPPQPRRAGPPERTAVMRGPNDPRVRPPVSPGPRGADQTMIARSPLADVPTQLHNRVPADYADPTRQGGPGYGPNTYGAPGGPPPVGPGGYGHPAGHSGGSPAGYPGGAPPYGPDPYAQPAGYPPPPGYGPPGQPDPYAPPPPGYGPPPAHGPQGGYDEGHDPRGPRPGQPPHGDPRRVDWLDD
jgi:hypothetical protein